MEVLSELARALSRESIDVATRAHVVTMPLCRFLLPVSDNTTRRRRALLAQLCLQSGAAAHLVLALASSSALYLGGPPGPNQSREQASAATLAQDVSFLLANVLLPLPAVEPPSVQAALRQSLVDGIWATRACRCSRR
ncbi:phosphonoacetate hydrolase [Micractinium conductrix]|uniref:Phosphonoacetate hydrolase n=1 Tax=Micractinium conductrix TaxID=554055 RepID=A0A2P6V2J4_9CHLO|nr:phosphonoacetate hydrolase [Micractinium conductrix]|eukprot:PSC68302.1 phosphonoacetate hydrolase [Micractinium conductrix]